jgi:hypothetical protein
MSETMARVVIAGVLILGFVGFMWGMYKIGRWWFYKREDLEAEEHGRYIAKVEDEYLKERKKRDSSDES